MENITYSIIWWGWLLILGIVFIPLSFIVFKNYFDKGYGLSKTIALLFTSYTVFLLSTIKILPFYRWVIFLVLLAFALINSRIYRKNKFEINKAFAKSLKLFIFEEIFFLGGLSLWTFVRLHQPDINGLEKLMDFGFVNSILRSKYLPPADMWAAGLPINYYWFGHYVTAFLTKLINIPSGVAYNLMLGTILGLSLTSSFSLVTTLISKVHKNSKKATIIGGLISAILLNFAGNFHTPYYVLKNGVDKYWYPDATRFIGYNPDVADKTIHEFPIYSYVVSDLHAHLLNLPFVLLFLSLLYVFVSSKKKDAGHQTGGIENLKIGKLIGHWLLIIGNFQMKFLVLLGILLGVMFMTNAWDLANYLLVIVFVFLLPKIFKFKPKKIIDNVFKISIKTLIITIVAAITALPFLFNFESIAQGVGITHTKTPLWQLSILWGFPVLLTAMFAIRIIIFKKVKRSDVFVTALLTASWFLIFIPEFIYVKDIYAETHYRANTMFKLTYQAFVMFYLLSGYITVTILKTSKAYVSKTFLVIIFTAAFTSILYYPFLATKSYYGKVFDKTNKTKSLSGDSWIKTKYPDTLKVINWFRQNVDDQPVILEAPGDSYTDYDIISSYTGLPTVSGWYVHEWLWRGSSDFPALRVNDITQIYNTSDVVLTKNLVNKYSVKYIIVGSFEKEKFPELNEEKFLQIGKVVYRSGSSTIYQMLNN